MSVVKRPILPPVTVGFRIDAKLPVLTFAAQVDAGSSPVAHSHPRGQLIYARQGIMHVVSQNTRWLVPPSQGLWIAPNVEHQVIFPGAVSLANLFIDPSCIKGLPVGCVAIQIDDLLRGLISRAVGIGESYKPETPEYRVMLVLVDELKRAQVSRLKLPLSEEPRVRRVMQALNARPGDDRDLSAWAKLACTSSRTLARIFTTETGLTFGKWRTQLRLLKAVDRITDGESVTEVALDLGYRSVSAFIAAFRRTTGISPLRFVQSGARTFNFADGDRSPQTTSGDKAD